MRWGPRSTVSPRDFITPVKNSLQACSCAQFLRFAVFSPVLPITKLLRAAHDFG
jgi:hypothetical protein